MSTLVSVLEEVGEGKSRFSPTSTAEADMRDFQPIAKFLLHAQQEGFLEKCVPHKESQTGNDWYDLIMVVGGLSYKGEMFLRQSVQTNTTHYIDKIFQQSIPANAEKDINDIFQLKPNIYGFSIDLKALWKRWKQRKA